MLRMKKGFFNKGKRGAGPSSRATSVAKATNVFKNPRKPRKGKGFTHG